MRENNLEWELIDFLFFFLEYGKLEQYKEQIKWKRICITNFIHFVFPQLVD